MTLQIHTSRIDYRGPDRLDITRGSGKGPALAFAPSWELLWWLRGHSTTDRTFPLEAAKHWRTYQERYLEEMRISYQDNRVTWDNLLGRHEVTLCCYCVDSLRCHRTLLAELLVKCGAVYRGER